MEDDQSNSSRPADLAVSHPQYDDVCNQFNLKHICTTGLLRITNMHSESRIRKKHRVYVKHREQNKVSLCISSIPSARFVFVENDQKMRSAWVDQAARLAVYCEHRSRFQVFQHLLPWACNPTYAPSLGILFEIKLNPLLFDSSKVTVKPKTPNMIDNQGSNVTQCTK